MVGRHLHRLWCTAIIVAGFAIGGGAAQAQQTDQLAQITIVPPRQSASPPVIRPGVSPPQLDLSPPQTFPGRATVGSPPRFVAFFAVLFEASSSTRSIGLTVATTGLSWQCRDNACTSEGGDALLTVQTCRELAAQVGAITIMMTTVDRLTQPEIGRCNNPAFIPPPPPGGLIATPPPPPVTLAPGAVLRPLPQRITPLRVPSEVFTVPPVITIRP